MKQRTFLKVAKDMFWVQMSWAFGFLGIMLAINIFKIIRATIQGNGVDNYYNSVFVAANIFMLVIGIISIYFLPHYVENGVTRKDYFKGTFIASLGLSVIVPIITISISTLQLFILKNIDKISFKEADINSIVSEINLDIGDMISDAVTTIILTPYVDPQSNWMLAIGIFSLNIFIYYLIGWLISASFYRFDTLTGLGFILIAFIILTFEDTLLRISLDFPVANRFSILESLPFGVTVLGILFLILVSIWIIRTLTKSVTIKI